GDVAEGDWAARIAAQHAHARTTAAHRTICDLLDTQLVRAPLRTSDSLTRSEPASMRNGRHCSPTSGRADTRSVAPPRPTETRQQHHDLQRCGASTCPPGSRPTRVCGHLASTR